MPGITTNAAQLLYSFRENSVSRPEWKNTKTMAYCGRLLIQRGYPSFACDKYT